VIQLLNSTKTSVVGVDFGACSLRAVQLQNTRSGWRVYHWINIEEDPTSPDPAPLDYARHLKLAFGPGAFTGRRSAIALGPPDAEYRLVEVPPSAQEQAPDEIRQALQAQLERQMPWPLDEAEITAWGVQAGATSSDNTMAVAACKANVQRYLDVFDTMSVECIGAEIVPNALAVACQPTPKPRSSDSTPPLWGALDIGFNACRLYLIHGDCPVYARILPASGRELTQTLAGSLQVAFPIAEHYKRVYGIEATDRGFRSSVGGLAHLKEDALPSVLYAILRQSLDNIIDEIERSYRFALGRLPGVPTGPLYLVGGGARMRGLPAVLSSRLGLDVCLPEPTTALQTRRLDDAEAIHPACAPENFAVLAPCIGLALMETLS
jgi:type IV pilus assembly protein PilM